jgi:iron complex outermembrane receptor protein
MSKSSVLTGKLHLLCGVSLLAVAIVCSSATASAADAKASESDVKTAKTTQVAQNQPTPSPAAADEPSPEVEKVTVTGFRRSLRSALDQKKNSNAQIDVVKAEDVAKFPDLNLSESLQRIPGVSITRDAGEGRQITVRGLGPNFTRVRINGMEALSTAGGTDAAGGTNRGRAFDFNVFAADLFNTMTVRKTPSAETEEGSLGASVRLRRV